MLTSRGSDIHGILIVYNISLCHVHLICHIVIYTFIIRSIKILRSNLPIHKNVCDSLSWGLFSIFQLMHIHTFTRKLCFRNERSNRGKMLPRAARNCQKTMERVCRGRSLKAWKILFCVNFLFIFFPTSRIVFMFQ
jgi:hypothetical protein